MQTSGFLPAIRQPPAAADPQAAMNNTAPSVRPTSLFGKFEPPRLDQFTHVPLLKFSDQKRAATQMTQLVRPRPKTSKSSHTASSPVLPSPTPQGGDRFSLSPTHADSKVVEAINARESLLRRVSILVNGLETMEPEAARHHVTVVLDLMMELRACAVQVVEGIAAWHDACTGGLKVPFFWGGTDYMQKMHGDCDFLAGSPLLVEALQVEALTLLNNPLMMPRNLAAAEAETGLSPAAPVSPDSAWGDSFQEIRFDGPEESAEAMRINKVERLLVEHQLHQRKVALQQAAQEAKKEGLSAARLTASTGQLGLLPKKAAVPSRAPPPGTVTVDKQHHSKRTAAIYRQDQTMPADNTRRPHSPSSGSPVNVLSLEGGPSVSSVEAIDPNMLRAVFESTKPNKLAGVKLKKLSPARQPRAAPATSPPSKAVVGSRRAAPAQPPHVHAHSPEPPPLEVLHRMPPPAYLDVFGLTTADLEDLAAEADAPMAVRIVCTVVLILMSPGEQVPSDLSWASTRQTLGNPVSMMSLVQQFDDKSIPPFKLQALKPFLVQHDLSPNAVARFSGTAALLSKWILRVITSCDAYVECVGQDVVDRMVMHSRSPSPLPPSPAPPADASPSRPIVNIQKSRRSSPTRRKKRRVRSRSKQPKSPDVMIVAEAELQGTIDGGHSLVSEAGTVGPEGADGASDEGAPPPPPPASPPPRARRRRRVRSKSRGKRVGRSRSRASPSPNSSMMSTGTKKSLRSVVGGMQSSTISGDFGLESVSALSAPTVMSHTVRVGHMLVQVTATEHEQVVMIDALHPVSSLRYSEAFSLETVARDLQVSADEYQGSLGARRAFLFLVLSHLHIIEIPTGDLCMMVTKEPPAEVVLPRKQRALYASSVDTEHGLWVITIMVAHNVDAERLCPIEVKAYNPVSGHEYKCSVGVEELNAIAAAADVPASVAAKELCDVILCHVVIEDGGAQPGVYLAEYPIRTYPEHTAGEPGRAPSPARSSVQSPPRSPPRSPARSPPRGPSPEQSSQQARSPSPPPIASQPGETRTRDQATRDRAVTEIQRVARGRAARRRARRERSNGPQQPRCLLRVGGTVRGLGLGLLSVRRLPRNPAGPRGHNGGYEVAVSDMQGPRSSCKLPPFQPLIRDRSREITALRTALKRLTFVNGQLLYLPSVHAASVNGVEADWSAEVQGSDLCVRAAVGAQSTELVIPNGLSRVCDTPTFKSFVQLLYLTETGDEYVWRISKERPPRPKPALPTIAQPEETPELQQAVLNSRGIPRSLLWKAGRTVSGRKVLLSVRCGLSELIVDGVDVVDNTKYTVRFPEVELHMANVPSSSRSLLEALQSALPGFIATHLELVTTPSGARVFRVRDDDDHSSGKRSMLYEGTFYVVAATPLPQGLYRLQVVDPSSTWMTDMRVSSLTVGVQQADNLSATVDRLARNLQIIEAEDGTRRVEILS